MVIRTDAWQDIEHKIGQKYRTQNRTNTSHKKSDKTSHKKSDKYFGQKGEQKSRTKIGQKLRQKVE